MAQNHPTPRKSELAPQSAANLRANLLKRKTQARERGTLPAPATHEGSAHDAAK